MIRSRIETFQLALRRRQVSHAIVLFLRMEVIVSQQHQYYSAVNPYTAPLRAVGISWREVPRTLDIEWRNNS